MSVTDSGNMKLNLLFISTASFAIFLAHSFPQIVCNDTLYDDYKYGNSNFNYNEEGDSDEMFSKYLYTKAGRNVEKFVKLRTTICRIFRILCERSLPIDKDKKPLINQIIWFEPSEYTEATARLFIETLSEEMRKKQHELTTYSWNSATNLTEYNEKLELRKSAEMAKFSNASLHTVNKFPWSSFHDPDLKRQFSKYAYGGTEVLPVDEYVAFNEYISKMVTIFSTSRVCEYKNQKNCTLPLNPDLLTIFEKSSDPEELKYYWVKWRNASGEKCKQYFNKLTHLLNKTAHLNNFANAKKLLLSSFEDDDFEPEVERLWKDVKPLYTELHAYVRRLLGLTYGEDIVPESGPIPAHLLGDMWAQDWTNIYDKTIPYENGMRLHVISDILKRDYTPVAMFKLAEKFYQSVNFTKLPDSFYKKSVLEKPKDRDIICHANAWDFFENDDYRIKMCTLTKINDFYTVHHELGHIYYYIHYKNQPFAYRNGANPGFHEAVGDAIDLSINPVHLHEIGLLPTKVDVNDFMVSINYLYSIALRKLPLLPWAYIMDLWRWRIYTGEIKPENYNCAWWKLRYEYQGIEPPVVRSEKDFDPPSKFHIAANVPYIRYFVSVALQFQFHRTMCVKAGLFDPTNPKKYPLHYCNISKNPIAGNAFGKMLAMGSSKPWRDILESFTGERTINAKAMLEYFAPLYEWLREENRRYKTKFGWTDTPMRTGCVSEGK